MADEGVPDHKLCGFLCAVLSVHSSDLYQDLSLGSPCFIFCDGFKLENGIVLSYINSNSCLKNQLAANGDVSGQEVGQCGTPDGEFVCDDRKMENTGGLENSPKRRRFLGPESTVKSPASQKSKRRGFSGSKSVRRETKTGRGRKRVRNIAMVNGSISVVQQLYALVTHKCLKILSRVVWADNGDNGEARAVVLVDVFLRVALWSGWQFPKCQSAAAALFKHLSCDWRLRSSILGGENCWEKANIWDLSDCHVLGCELYCNAPDSSKKKLFKLHEIFKSLPSPESKGMLDFSRVTRSTNLGGSGIWDISDDIFFSILNRLSPKDLVRVAATCRHLRSLASLIMPCMTLKLFPHQQAAVEWMLQRERKPEVLSNPLYKKIDTEDGFCFYFNVVCGDIVTDTAPTIKDFCGGMFCDEPGLGKTITALSLILKTQGSMADPPDGLPVIWCTHNYGEKCAYYEKTCEQSTSNSISSVKKVPSTNGRRAQFSLDSFSPLKESNCLSVKRARSVNLDGKSTESAKSSFGKETGTPYSACLKSDVQRRSSLSNARRNLLHAYDGESGLSAAMEAKRTGNSKKHQLGNLKHVYQEEQDVMTIGHERKGNIDVNVQNETWIQCDSCSKWRRIIDGGVSEAVSVWFCSMNADSAHRSCKDPQESWDSCEPIKYLQGFYTKGTSGEKDENVSFFTHVLREHKFLINSTTKKALTWLAKLPLERLSLMETVGLPSPLLGSCVSLDIHGFHNIFQAFGLVKRVEKGVTRWYYPKFLDNLIFDLPALRVALCEPLDTLRLYLSKATLVVVPANLVDHWKTQIERHVRPGQLRLFIWTDHKKPSAHSLAWDYDVVITTFSRLSAEWGPRKKSPLIQVHWLRVMLDEGHTLGSSFNLTNKLQMAISLTSSNRWILTGTPTPNTPSSQLSHLQPLLKFLHEEVYGENIKIWEAGILRPFEAEMEEGRSRLLQLLQRCMISARKKDLQTIPPCIKKVTYINFTLEHASSYNELVETVRRNILMADWNDPSHVESLLNPKQRKFRSATIRNVRLSCCVAGHIKMTDAGQDIRETMDILVGTHLDPCSEEYSSIKDSLLSGCNCHRCREWCRLPVITPCSHLLCLDCIALDSERCTFPGCGFLYEMQTPESLARPENPNPKWPVPKDLIELQPSYKQDDWNPDWQSTSSSKVSYLVDRLRKLCEANREIILSFNKSRNVNMVDNPLVALSASNSGALLEPDLHRLVGSGSNKGFIEKVLIFSQFLEHIHVIEHQLTVAGIKFAGMYSPMHSASKMRSLAMFQHDADCLALLMDGSAALGLDLSFVTHVFLMEPIWDKSMEEQVISRAHRMGATRPIHVETLAMRGTIEEQMMKFLEDVDKYRRIVKEEHVKPEHETRVHRTLHDFAESNYLANLSFVRKDVKA